MGGTITAMTGTEIEKPKLSVSNTLLLKHALLSLNEIEAKTGIPAIQAGQRITDLLDDRDWLSMRRKELLLIMDMQDLVNGAKDRLGDADNENYAKIANVALRGMNSIGQRLDAQRKLVEADINEITAAHGRIFGQAFDIALKHVITTLMAENPEIEQPHVRALVREGMALAEEKLQEYMNEE